MQTKEQNIAKNMKALGITLGVHALILLALTLFSFSAPPPLPNQDLGMEVNLGTSDQGMGEEQPLNPNPPSNSIAAPQPTQSVPQPTQNATPPENIATQNEEEAPEVTKPVKPVPPPKVHPLNITPEVKKPTKAIMPETPPAPPEKPRVPRGVASAGTFSNSKSGNGADGSNNSKGEGNTGQPGDRGAIGGNPNGGGYTGTGGLGGGKSDFRLNGRDLIGRPQVTYNGSESGYVAVTIKVDRDGNVIAASLNLKGSTLNNPQQISIALDAARRIKYNSSPDAPEVQFGNIRFFFKVE